MRYSISSKIIPFTLMFLSTLLMSSESFGQKDKGGIKVEGSVTDTEGRVIKGATILIKGITSGTVTTIEGNFAFTVPSEFISLIS
ncbi:carboxypeptidase regulatory-like domain-containing protein [Algoriphagus boritolerans]|uniref:CarboxypepD_reg-like domain-containing protein n=1 Tax=Algoriphagus boritolerans DSM 17298 = JCM 18970 TaxID=1120964 RepID=A0A1H5VPV3_9BACT|nr:carboxypeptidase regulatory-like domain-containing protein [Algoriphagus boritolerans]SEF89203.1 hypothetical protein SAMN03080598_01788 [Algoriphagus boritolerans DSM 17298 = JCM 18970]